MPEKSQEELDRVAMALNESPFYKYLGMRIVRLWEGHSEMHLELSQQHKNIWNTFHGGVIASVMDSSCGSSIYSSLQSDEGAITIDLRVNYLCPPKDGLLVCKGKFVYRTKNLAWSESEAFDRDNNLIARAQAVHRIIRRDWGK